MTTRILAVIAALALAACGDDAITAPTPEPTYADVAGTYNGNLIGESGGVTVNTSWVLTLARNGGDVTGTIVSNGTLSDFSGTFETSGNSAFTGTVGTGTNPFVTITGGVDVCGIATTWSGTYTAANRRLVLSGDLTYYDVSTCELVIAFVGSTVEMFK